MLENMDTKAHTGLRKHTSLGMTWGQMISTVGLLGAIITAWVSINVQIAQQKTVNEQQEIRIQMLEAGRQQNAQAIQQLRVEFQEAFKTLSQENRDDHIRIMEKQDQVYRSIRSNQ
jgi:hypothetical protein